MLTMRSFTTITLRMVRPSRRLAISGSSSTIFSTSAGSAPAGAEPSEVEKIVLDDPEIARRLEGLTIRKVIVVKDRIVNIVAA